MTDLPDTFAALGDATRFAIVERLMRDGELPVSDLRGVSPVSAPAMSRHLKVLREAGVVVQRAEAQRRYYRVRPEAVQAISDWMMSYGDFWAGSLDRLARMIAERKPE